MARVAATWRFPSYSPYSILNVINPLVAWVAPINNPLVREFRVQIYDVKERVYRDVGKTDLDYINIPTDDYRLESIYRIRIATITTDGRQSPYSEGASIVASPLRFDFSTATNVVLPNGTSTQTQRLLFLLF